MDPEGAINSILYPIAVDQNGEVLWRTVQVAEEQDEVWDDWSEGAGETKKETGRGYLWSSGFDASSPGVLRLSPHYLSHNNTSLTTGYGYFMEATETTGSSLSAVDTPTKSEAAMTSGSSFSWTHTVNSSAARIVIVGLSISSNAVGSGITVTYAGQDMINLAGFQGLTTNNTSVWMYYLLSPVSGANTILVTNGNAQSYNVVAGAISYSGVNQDTPFGTVVAARGTDSTPTVTVTSATGDIVVVVLSAEGISTIAAGTGETEQWDDSLTDITGGGYTQAGAASVVIAPSTTTTDWTLTGASLKPSSTTSRSVMWVGDGTNMFRYNYDTSGGPTLAGTQAIASATAIGQPAKLSGKWYAGMGNGTFAYRLDDASSDTGWVITDWKAGHLSTFQKGILPTAARSNTTNTNVVDINDISAGGNVADAWTSDSQKVGDSTTAITALVEAAGNLYVAKEDSLYEFGTEAESRNAIPFLSRGKIDSENGKGTIAFGNIIIYPSKDGLWRYIIGRSALPIGVNTLRRWRAPAAISIPKGGRHAQAVYSGEYIYVLLNQVGSYLLQGRFRQSDDTPGHEIILHPVLTLPGCKGMGIDSLNRLWLKGVSSLSASRNIFVIELAPDGSLDTTNRKGQASTVHTIQLDERNPGRPQDMVQLRRYTVDLEGTWDSTTSLQFRVYLDNAAVASIENPITASGVTTRNWTVGTSDTAYRFRPELQVTTNSSYTPLTMNPRILRLIVGIRFPEIIKIVIPADDGALQPYGLTANIAEQNLQRLQNQGVVAFRRPGTTATFNADIMSIADTTYATPTGYSRGMEITARRWVTT